MSIVLSHPDGEFSISYVNQVLIVAVWNESRQDDDKSKIQLTPLGLIDLGQKLIQEGVSRLAKDPE